MSRTTKEQIITLDPQSPLVLDVHDLAHKPGSSREVNRVVEIPAVIGTSIIAIQADEDINVDLRLECVHEGILVTGQINAEAVGECVRCLDPMTKIVRSYPAEMYLYPEKKTNSKAKAPKDDEEDDGDEEEVSFLDDNMIDLSLLIVDTLVPALPFQPLCRKDCAGLCPECGVKLDDEPDHEHEILDPRWSALAGLTGGDDTPADK